IEAEKPEDAPFVAAMAGDEPCGPGTKDSDPQPEFRPLDDDLKAEILERLRNERTESMLKTKIDEAITRVSREVQDWAGGTRIGESIQAFNSEYARRVLRNGAVVLIISDGWDRGDPQLLGAEMMRLQRSCYRLIWLNPLLGSPRYQPLTRGMQAALPYIDDFMPVHNLESLELLADHLSNVGETRPVRKQAPLEYVNQRLAAV
ncbi:MAG: VWA domain-containing protein, partial [Thermomicrobiales bacterium]